MSPSSPTCLLTVRTCPISKARRLTALGSNRSRDKGCLVYQKIWVWSLACVLTGLGSSLPSFLYQILVLCSRGACCPHFALPGPGAVKRPLSHVPGVRGQGWLLIVKVAGTEQRPLITISFSSATRGFTDELPWTVSALNCFSANFSSSGCELCRASILVCIS